MGKDWTYFVANMQDKIVGLDWQWTDRTTRTSLKQSLRVLGSPLESIVLQEGNEALVMR